LSADRRAISHGSVEGGDPSNLKRPRIAVNSATFCAGFLEPISAEHAVSGRYAG
jgi:hypothetical protein